MSKTTQDFLIERSSKPVVKKAIMIVLLSYALLLFSLLLIVAIRNALGIDSTLVGISFVLFGLFSILTTASLYTLLDGWLRVSYFVSGGQLHIKSKSKNFSSSTRSLNDLMRVSAAQSYKMFTAQNHGEIVLEFAKAGSSEKLVLKDVSDPDRVAAVLSKRIKGAA